MKNNKTLGVIIAIVGILTGLLVLYLLASTYQPVVQGKILDGRPDEAITVRIVFALLGWVGMTAGAIWAAVLYGFIKGEKWAWFWGVVAATMQILAGFFPMIPPASIGMPTPTLWVFLIAFALWFGMLLIENVNWKIITIAFLGGLAYVLTFIDGVGAISRYQTVPDGFPNGMYAMGMLINWWAAVAIAVFIFALVKGKKWAIPMGIFATVLSMFAGYPVGITDVARLGRFSMFLAGPMMSTILLIIILLPGTQRIITEWVGKQE
jgi:hypothetical protein